MDCAPHFEKLLYDNSQLARVYLHAWQVTGNEFFRTINAGFLLQYVQTDTGRLFHTWNAAEGIVGQEGGGIAKVDGFLEDYANLAEGLLALYQLTSDPRWYQAAHDLLESALDRFWVGGEGIYDTATDTEKFVIRPRDLHDNATP